ncbi:MAG: F0F1 ATP synthase subunit delta [Romboutsia sp.]|jgi:F-type H+-transporting ATPase subunit delta|nr:F0F1 ATP synthase subunit delta [Romboutsia sp.]
MINVIADRYAQALFEVGEETQATSELYQELKQLVVILNENKDLYNFLKSPLIGREDKKNVMKNIFENQLSDNMNNFLKIVIDKDRMSAIENIKESYKNLLNDKNNILEGTVVTAVSLSEQEIKDLEKNLSIKYNKNVTLNNIVDETILGGVLVKLGNEEIDGTVKTRLAKIKNQLSQVIS